MTYVLPTATHTRTSWLPPMFLRLDRPLIPMLNIFFPQPWMWPLRPPAISTEKLWLILSLHYLPCNSHLLKYAFSIRKHGLNLWGRISENQENDRTGWASLNWIYERLHTAKHFERSHDANSGKFHSREKLQSESRHTVMCGGSCL